jgi:alkyl sulfatase BDS1-like metallo-beta-lactamase superfamily hydrolase
MQRLAGGAEKLLATAQDALSENDSQWALVCAQAVMRANEENDSLTSQAKIVAIDALQRLAEGQISANGRNYYLTYARELSGSLSLTPSTIQVTGALKYMGAVEIVKLLPLRLNADNCMSVQSSLLYKFPDIKRSVLLSINCGIARAEEVIYDSNDVCPDLVVTVTSTIFVDIAAKTRNKTAAVLAGEMVVEGKGIMSSIALKTFMDYFDDSSVPYKVGI